MLQSKHTQWHGIILHPKTNKKPSVWMKNKSSCNTLKYDCEHQNKMRQTYILHSYFFSTLHHPTLCSSLPLFGSSVLALSISAMWLTGVVGVVMVTISQYVARMQQAGSRKRTAHTGHYGNTPPRGPQWLILPETLVPLFDWTQCLSLRCLRPPL